MVFSFDENYWKVHKIIEKINYKNFQDLKFKIGKLYLLYN